MTALLLLAFAAPPPEELIRRAIDAEAAQDKQGRRYTYTETITQQTREKDGKFGEPRVEKFEVVMLEGENYRKLVERNQQPLSSEEQQRVAAQMEKERQQRRRRQLLPRTIRRNLSLGDLQVLLDYFENRVEGEETIQGRKAWVIASQPRPKVKPKNREEEQYLAAARRSWIDQETGFVARREDRLLREKNGFQPGSVFVWEYRRQSDGYWLLDTLRLDFQLKAYKFVGLGGRTVQQYANYRRFEVESTLKPDSQ